MNKHCVEFVTLALFLVLTCLVQPAVLQADDAAAAYHPVITEVEGSVKVMGIKYAVWEPATAGMLLLSGDVIQTGWDSRAEIRFLSGTVHLYENTMLVVPSIGVQDRKKDIQDVVVEERDALFEINPLGVQRQFEFRTKNVQGGVKGTAFLVSYLHGGTTINVFEGTVWASGPGRDRGKSRILNAGEALRVVTEEDWETDIRRFTSDGSHADYSYTVPPGLDVKTRLPGDVNADPDNKGVRQRGNGLATAPGQNK